MVESGIYYIYWTTPKGEMGSIFMGQAIEEKCEVFC